MYVVGVSTLLDTWVVVLTQISKYLFKLFTYYNLKSRGIVRTINHVEFISTLVERTTGFAIKVEKPLAACIKLIWYGCLITLRLDFVCAATTQIPNKKAPQVQGALYSFQIRNLHIETLAKVCHIYEAFFCFLFDFYQRAFF